MTDTPVSFLSNSDIAGQNNSTFPQAEFDTCFYRWVRACLDDGVQELDTMVMTAPDSLRSQFCCYDVMADEIEMVIQRIWTDFARQRMRAGR